MKGDRLHIDMRFLNSYNALKLYEKKFFLRSKQDVLHLFLMALIIAWISPVLNPLSQHFSGPFYIDGFYWIGNI